MSIDDGGAARGGAVRRGYASVRGTVQSRSGWPPVAPSTRPPRRHRSTRGPLRAQPSHPRPDRPATDRPEAGARQMINHRGPEFAEMLARILDGMKPFFGTTSRHRDHHDAPARAVSRPPSSTRCRPVTGCSASHRLVRRPVREDRGDLRRGRHEARCRVGLCGGRRRDPRASPDDARRRRPCC